MIFDKYPYTNFHEMNDDWIIQAMRELKQELDDFVATNHLTYADPIEYNPDSAYPAFTIVTHNNTAYLSKRAVPAGTIPSDLTADYWLMVFPFGDLINEAVDMSLEDLEATVNEYMQQAIDSLPAIVADWLAEHPEVTTTIPDEAISFPKLSVALRDVLFDGYDASVISSSLNSSVFTQGSLSNANGSEIAASNACRTGFVQFEKGVVVVRSATDYVSKVYRYTAEEVFVDIPLSDIDIQWNAFAADPAYKYRFVIVRDDSADFTPADLPLVPIPYYMQQSSYEPQSDMDMVLSVLGINTASEPKPMFNDADWARGYLAEDRVRAIITQNDDFFTTKAARVHAGDVVTVTIRIPLTETRAYLYYAYVRGVNNLTYVSQRYGGPSAYNNSDENYRYYTVSITVESDGYIIFSYRPHGEPISASQFLNSSTTNNIERLDNRIDDVENELDANATEPEYYRFPSDEQLPICVCHRGLASSGLPENTIPAFYDAWESGWKWLETDIRMTSDGVWVCLHDETINRTGRNADGTAISETIKIADITYAQALTYDFGIYAGQQYAGTKILSLDDFLNFCNKSHLYAQLEIKNSTWTKAQVLTAWTIVQKYRMERKVMLLCSSIGPIDDLLEDYPYVSVAITRTGAWTPIAQADWATTVPYPNGVKSGKNKVYWEQKFVDFSSKTDMQNFVDYCHHWGLNAGVYCPTTGQEMSDLVDTLDIACSQYIKYDEAKLDALNQ